MIYLVTSGEYSDYRVETAFSTPEKADEYIDRWTGGVERSWGSKRVEEYEVDVEPLPKYLRVEMNSDGEVLSANGVDEASPPEFFTPYASRGVVLYVTVRTDSSERAIKAAAEKWAVIKATIPWGDQSALKELL